jgi:hypothetical protein
MQDEQQELLAEYAHEAWSGWMKWMFETGGKLMYTDSTHAVWAMHPDKFVRWQRQMNTPYADLPESEKASDRDEANKIRRLLGLLI